MEPSCSSCLRGSDYLELICGPNSKDARRHDLLRVAEGRARGEDDAEGRCAGARVAPRHVGVERVEHVELEADGLRARQAEAARRPQVQVVPLRTAAFAIRLETQVDGAESAQRRARI